MIISASNLTRTYSGNIHAVDDVSFQIKAGDFIAITGPSGCGKSTLLNMLAAMDAPDSGTLVVDGIDLKDASEPERTEYRRTVIGMVFQFFNLLPTLTAAENVAIPRQLAGGKNALDSAHEALDRVGLSTRADHLPKQLSGGEMQRVAIARAIAHRPKLLIADEPTGNLDSQSELQILDLFDQLHSEGLTIAVVTHSAVVANRARRTIRLRDGRLDGEGSAS